MVPEEPNDSRQEDKTGPLVQAISEIISKGSRDTGPETMKVQEEDTGGASGHGCGQGFFGYDTKSTGSKDRTRPGGVR